MIDKKGYLREAKHSNAWHRKVAYYKIYLKNREKYPLPFSEYEVHHKDGNKLNNNLDNLEILNPEEHIDKHLEIERKTQEDTKHKNEGAIMFISKLSKIPVEEINERVNVRMKRSIISKELAISCLAGDLRITLPED